MKRELLIFFALGIFFFGMSNVLAEACNLEVSMINQDPYPANPGEYVKIVFQIGGISNPQCGEIEFELLENYPLIFDPGFNSKNRISSGVYSKDYGSFFLAPYRVRVDENALDGNNPIEVSYSIKGSSVRVQESFNLRVKDTEVDFEIHIKNYNPVTRTITFEILNIGSSDIYALTLEIPKQESIQVKNSPINIVGDVDSKEYITANFEAKPSNGQIKVLLHYNDEINVRRTVEKFVTFDSSYFEGNLQSEAGKKSVWTYLVWIIIIGIVGYFFYKKWKKRKVLRDRLNRR